MIYDASPNRLLCQGAPLGVTFPWDSFRLSEEQREAWPESSPIERAQMMIDVFDAHAPPGSQITFGRVHIIYISTFGGIVAQPPKSVQAEVFKEILKRLPRLPETYEEEVDLLAEAEFSGGVKIFKIYRDFMKSRGRTSDWTKKKLVDHLTKPAMQVVAEAALSPEERRAYNARKKQERSK